MKKSRKGKGPVAGGTVEKLRASRSSTHDGHWLRWVALGPALLALVFPFLVMLSTSVKPAGEVFRHPPSWLPEHPAPGNFAAVWSYVPLGRYFLNSLAIAGGATALNLALALPAGYALARLTGKWGERLGIAIFLTYLVPSTLLFIPMSRIVASLGLQDTLWSLVLVYPSFTIPFCVWLLMGFFKSIPKDIEEAAMVDGCSRARAIVRIIMPISLAGILSAVIFAFTLTIQEFTYALTFITSSGQQTVSVGVPTNLVRGDVFFWGSLMAACLITSIPVAVLYNLCLDRFIAGFTVGAIK
jgi:multiple sugar transport system permease protein